MQVDQESEFKSIKDPRFLKKFRLLDGSNKNQYVFKSFQHVYKDTYIYNMYDIGSDHTEIENEDGSGGGFDGKLLTYIGTEREFHIKYIEIGSSLEEKRMVVMSLYKKGFSTVAISQYLKIDLYLVRTMINSIES